MSDVLIGIQGALTHTEAELLLTCYYRSKWQKVGVRPTAGIWIGSQEPSNLLSMKINGTPEDSINVENRTNNWTPPWYQDKFVFSACILSLIFLIAILSNFWLSLALFRSRSLRSVTFNLLILHVSLVCLLECALNIPVSFYHNIRRTPNFTGPSDPVNEFTLQLIAIEITFSVCVMCVQRWLASWRPDQLKRCLSIAKQTVVIATMWIVGLLFSVPVLGVEFDNGFYQPKLVKKRFLYIYLVISFCYLLPMVIGIICLGLLFLRRCKDIKNRVLRRLDMTYTEMFFEESYIWNEWESTKLLLVITVLYVVTVIPYVLVQYFRKLCKNSYSNKIGLGTLWLRYSLCCTYPLIIVFMRRDIRQKVNAMLPRRRSSNTRYRQETWGHSTGHGAPLLLAKTAGIQFKLLGINIDNLKQKLWVNETSFPARSEAVRPASLPLEKSCVPTKSEDVNFEDATEEEIDCSSLTCTSPIVKEIAVQTTDGCPEVSTIKDKSRICSRKRRNFLCVRKNFVLTHARAKCLPKRFKVVRLKYYRVSLNVHLSAPKKQFTKERMATLAEEEC